MIYVVALLWTCALTGAALALWLIRELTTPVNRDVVDLQRYRDARAAFGRMNTRHSISTPAARLEHLTAGVDTSRATSYLASEGRPASAPVIRAKVDRPTPAADGTASHEAAGTTGRATHAPRAHAGPPARHLHRI